MSGVYIRGMEMPKSCYECHIRQRKGLKIVCPILREEFTIADVNIFSFRLKDCPLTHVPDHGRLIDGDVAEVISYSFEDSDGGFADGILYSADWIASQPTIIPADMEGE